MKKSNIIEMSDRVIWSGMTLRQYAAIHLGVPESGAEWLDDMIRKANEGVERNEK